MWFSTFQHFSSHCRSLDAQVFFLDFNVPNKNYNLLWFHDICITIINNRSWERLETDFVFCHLLTLQRAKREFLGSGTCLGVFFFFTLPFAVKNHELGRAKRKLVFSHLPCARTVFLVSILSLFNFSAFSVRKIRRTEQRILQVLCGGSGCCSLAWW